MLYNHVLYLESGNRFFFSICVCVAIMAVILEKDNRVVRVIFSELVIMLAKTNTMPCRVRILMFLVLSNKITY